MVTAGRRVLNLVQVLYHARIVQPVRPETSEQEAQEVQQSQSAYQLGQHEQDIVPLDVDRFFEWILAQVDYR